MAKLRLYQHGRRPFNNCPNDGPSFTNDHRLDVTTLYANHVTQILLNKSMKDS